MTYCEFVRSESAHPVHKHYHDNVYGFPVSDDNIFFERLILEINQAGLSWEIILKKQENFQKAFDGFDIAKVAAYTETDKTRLREDAGIIRNHLKIEATIENAKRIQTIQAEHGSFKAWLDSHALLYAHHPQSKDEWTRLFKKTFKFAGGEIVNEFLMSTGYLPGAHDPDCPVLKQIMLN
jgi:DNA-3-methyladenine glycosylase I